MNEILNYCRNCKHCDIRKDTGLGTIIYCHNFKYHSYVYFDCSQFKPKDNLKQNNMIKVEFTQEEFILLIQGISSRKKVFRAKIRNNEIQIETGKTKMPIEDLERNIRKRQKQIAEMEQLSAKLDVIAYRNDLNPDTRMALSLNCG